MSTPLWEFQYSLEADVHPGFAWQFWTNIANWRELEPGVEFVLDGPFAPGTRGCTRMPGQEPRHWLIHAVDPGRSWTLEMSLLGASFMVSMHFEEVVRPDFLPRLTGEEERASGRSRITQRLWLEGEGAEALLDGVRLFETTTPDGLKRIATVIEKAQRTASDPRR